MPTERERAEAAEVLAEPIGPEPKLFRQIAAMFSPDGKPGEELNPDYIEWAARVRRKLVALAVVLGIDAKEKTAEMNWEAVAHWLAMRFHPSFRPRKGRGRPLSKFSEDRYAQRRELLRLVDNRKEKSLSGRRDIEGIIKQLKKDGALPSTFQGMRTNTIRQEVSIARKEARVRNKIMAGLLLERTRPTDYSQFLHTPGRDFSDTGGMSGLGLLASPIQKSD